MIEIKKTAAAKPFIRWAGGKRWLVKYINQAIPLNYNNYHEPFLGGGAIFFSLIHKNNVFLSDTNSELIEAYSCLKNDYERVITTLKSFKNDEAIYYKIRSKKFKNDYQRAARFIYLNKTSFNGIYRVNTRGEYNVPFGHIKEVNFIDKENLKLVSEKLQNVTLNCCDFGATLDNVQENDLVFLDPPYTVAHENNGFIEYNQKIFSLEDQKRLASFVEGIIEKRAFYILTNAKHTQIKKIYSNIHNPITLYRNSTVGGFGAERKEIREYIFTNLDIK